MRERLGRNVCVRATIDKHCFFLWGSQCVNTSGDKGMSGVKSL